jgi:hypothetical protein
MAELGSCPITLDGIGNGGCIKKPILGFITSFIPALESQQYDTFADFNSESVNKAQIIAEDLLPIKIFDEMENVSTEELTSETSRGTKLFHRNGRYGFIGKALLSPDQNRILQSYDQRVFAGYIMDDSGNRLGTSPDGTVVKPLSVSYFKVKPMDLPFAADGSAWSMVEVQFEFVDEINKQPAYSIADDFTWIPTKVIKPLTKITLTPGAMVAFAFTCSFAYVDPTTGKSVPLNSLGTDGAELTVLDQTGAAVTVTVAAVAGTPGDYTITDAGAAMTSGSIKLNAQVDSFYYSDTTTVSA